LSHISGKDRKKTFEDSGIEEVVHLADGGEIILITSVITRIEILAGKISDKNMNKYEETLIDNPNMEEIEVHRDISQVAQKIRSYYKKDGRNISTPDVIHLATAIWANADEFHTFDGYGKKKGLLDFNGEGGVDNIKIMIPKAKQGVLALKEKKQNDSKGSEVEDEEDELE